MEEKELTIDEQRKALYKASDEVIKLVENLVELFKTNNKSKLNVKLSFEVDNGEGGTDTITTKFIEYNPNDFSPILVHWEPDFTVSRHNDPFAAAYMLSADELKQITTVVEKEMGIKA